MIGINITPFKNLYVINTKISSFHMFISHLDFLVYELHVRIFPISMQFILLIL